MTWRPLEPARREPRPLADSLDRVARTLDAPPSAALRAVFVGWSDVVGPTVAAHCRPVSLRRKVLVVAVDEPGWATELRYLGPRLLQRVAGVTGPGVVEELEVRVRPRSDLFGDPRW